MCLSKVSRTEGTLTVFGKPCIPNLPLHPLALLSASYIQESIGKLFIQVSSNDPASGPT